VKLTEKANDLEQRLEALYEEAKEAGIGFAAFLDTCDGGMRVHITGLEATQENEDSACGFDLIEYWLASTEAGEAVLQLATARKHLDAVLPEDRPN